jgi:hypothetical protein
LPAKRNEPEQTPADLPPDKAHSVLSSQLAKLQQLKGQKYLEARADEKAWYQLTEKFVSRSFGSDSENVSNFRFCWYATQPQEQQRQSREFGQSVDYNRDQRNFEARLRAFEDVLKNCLEELQLNMPTAEIKGAYEPGEQWEFYRDVTACLKFAKKEIFVIDPYLNTEIFDVYANAIPRTVGFRLLSSNVPADVKLLAQKYAAGGNFAFRISNSIHDRVLFADNRIWFTGQSWKDAATKKPTYIVEHDEPLQRPIYEGIWQAARAI